MTTESTRKKYSYTDIVVYVKKKKMGLKDDLQMLADADSRSLSDYISIVLEQHVNTIREEGHDER
jgi:hypothetical protein|tara:strand:- start:3228 stop:3422 length:195 start_codon:yes stop_codon:yes gene_type:complete